MAGSIVPKLGALTPTEFENLTYDMVAAFGLHNLVWRTPGPDGGRDIEGYSLHTDMTGYQIEMRWHIECKRYSSSIDWPTVWGKIAYADSLSADYFLLCTNSNPSPTCETHILEWNNSKRRPTIRVWKGYDFDRILSYQPVIAAAYGLQDSLVAAEAGSLALSSIAQRLLQSAYVSMAMGFVPDSTIESAAAISELHSKRLSDIRDYNKFLPSQFHDEPTLYEWAEVSCSISSVDELGIRALTSFYKHSTKSSNVTINDNGDFLEIKVLGAKLELTNKAQNDLKVIAFWGMMEVNFPDLKSGLILIRGRKE